jgi:hypothetical protein
MDRDIATALIIAGGSALAAITALILSHRGFAALDRRFTSLEWRFTSIEGRFASMDNLFGSMEQGFDMLQADMKNLNKRMTALGVDLALVRNKVGG